LRKYTTRSYEGTQMSYECIVYEDWHAPCTLNNLQQLIITNTALGVVFGYLFQGQILRFKISSVHRLYTALQCIHNSFAFLHKSELCISFVVHNYCVPFSQGWHPQGNKLFPIFMQRGWRRYLQFISNEVKHWNTSSKK
jgi:hypothetical protein